MFALTHSFRGSTNDRLVLIASCADQAGLASSIPMGRRMPWQPLFLTLLDDLGSLILRHLSVVIHCLVPLGVSCAAVFFLQLRHSPVRSSAFRRSPIPVTGLFVKRAFSAPDRSSAFRRSPIPVTGLFVKRAFSAPVRSSAFRRSPIPVTGCNL